MRRATRRIGPRVDDAGVTGPRRLRVHGDAAVLHHACRDQPMSPINSAPQPQSARHSNTTATTDALTQVATVLTPSERLRVDAAGHGLYRSLHRDSVDDVMRDVREARAEVVVLSVSYCERSSNEMVASMV